MADSSEEIENEMNDRKKSLHTAREIAAVSAFSKGRSKVGKGRR